ncbi:MAG: UDP-N-acetylglucosamine--LPS N-acetylglucosamine transferase, partial [Actinobacteria bacterium]|nr:UDP-N-acetylglucosamine--LPS N-acetylglucosamine transferase [Actinomycetota bacterium]
MAKPTIILATSNGIGMGHLARATAIALELTPYARPIIVSVAGGIAELPSTTGIACEYIPGKNRGWMARKDWDSYLRDRLLAIAEESGASLISFDGVVPYPGFIATKLARPDLKLIWVRRGLWQRNALRFALPFQSRLVDQVIEPGDVAIAYDHGPTANRSDARLTSPVSLYRVNSAKSREEARKLLGLDASRPAVLVQLGTGDSDMNEKLRAALLGLKNWPNLQIVVTKNPVDSNGDSLVPEGVEVKVVRYFPLADLLSAFDGAIAATGYNSVHELLPARVPTVFISNIRGTDDQEARAQWCHDFGYALRANHADLKDITATVAQLCDSSTRAALSTKCIELKNTDGGAEIAQILLKMAIDQDPLCESATKSALRMFAVKGLHLATIVYRTLRPQSFATNISSEKPL